MDIAGLRMGAETIAAIGAAIAVIAAGYVWVRRTWWKPGKALLSEVRSAVAMLSPNGGKSLYDLVDRIDRRTAMSDQRTRALAAALDRGELTLCADGEVEAVSAALSRWLGRPDADFLGRAWISLLSPESRPAVMVDWLHAQKDRRPYEGVWRMADSYGGYVRLRVQANPVFEVEGGPSRDDADLVGWVVMLRKEEEDAE